MAHSTVRIAAGASVVAASLLIVGPNPADAAADKHGSGSRYGEDSENGQGGNAQRRASNWVNDVLNIGAGQAQNPDLDPPQMDFGTGGSDVEELAVVDSFAPQPQAALRSAAVVEAPAGDNMAAATPRSGSGYQGQPVTAFWAPRVVFGNGRIPGTHVPRPGSAAEAVLVQDAMMSPEAVPAAPAVPTAIEINIPPLPPPLPPVERIRPAELAVGEFGTGTTDTVADPLAGVAGLILIPAIGAVLGYRQARAAQSFRESLRT